MKDTRNTELAYTADNRTLSLRKKTKERRPQDWSLEGQLEIVMVCASLVESGVVLR
jgi:hypothetical protein